MESRWLAVVSLVIAFCLSIPTPAYSAAPKHKNSSKYFHRTITKKTVVRKTVFKHKSSVTHKPTITNIWQPPMKTTPYSVPVRKRVNLAFQHGNAAKFSPESMVRSKVFVHYPLKGGIRKRTGNVRYLVLHSTETGRPADARTVVQSWNNIGKNHPCAQYLVDRDGTIIQTVDPKYATVHVNDRTSIGGVKNDNSIGIEIVRTGKQKYTPKQLKSLTALVNYIQDRYNIVRVCGHGEIQPSDRSDPVAFNWAKFSRQLALIKRTQEDAKTAYNVALDGTEG